MTATNGGWRTRLTAAVPIILVAAGALLLRLPGLDRRPMHNDGANQAVKTGTLQETGTYRYDPVDHHGPTLYYAALPIARRHAGRSFADTSETTFRLVPVIFGTLLVLLVPLIGDGLGRGAACWAALLTAVSTAMVFYSRYYIQEILLVCFTFAALGTGWRWLQTRRLAWCLSCGACVGLMFATKETAVVACVAAAAALAATYYAAGRRGGIVRYFVKLPSSPA